MKKPMLWLSLVILLAGTGFGGADPAHASEADTQGVAAAADRFCAALNAMFTGDAEPMKAVWSRADDVRTGDRPADSNTAGRRSRRSGRSTPR